MQHKVLIYATSRYQIWVYRGYMRAVLSNGHIDNWSVEHSDDLFELPLKGLLRLTTEYIADIEKRFFGSK